MVKNLVVCALLGCIPLLAGCDAFTKGAKRAGNQAIERAVNTANDAITVKTREETDKIIGAGGEAVTKKITGSDEPEKKDEEKKDKEKEKEAEEK